MRPNVNNPFFCLLVFLAACLGVSNSSVRRGGRPILRYVKLASKSDFMIEKGSTVILETISTLRCIYLSFIQAGERTIHTSSSGCQGAPGWHRGRHANQHNCAQMRNVLLAGSPAPHGHPLQAPAKEQALIGQTRSLCSLPWSRKPYT